MTTLSPQPVARDKKSGDVVHVELDIEGKAGNGGRYGCRNPLTIGRAGSNPATLVHGGMAKSAARIRLKI